MVDRHFLTFRENVGRTNDIIVEVAEPHGSFEIWDQRKLINLIIFMKFWRNLIRNWDEIEEKNYAEILEGKTDKNMFEFGSCLNPKWRHDIPTNSRMHLGHQEMKSQTSMDNTYLW
jgi:hypothetical protein